MDIVLLQQVFHDRALLNDVTPVRPLPNTMQMFSVAEIQNLDTEEAQMMVNSLYGKIL